MSGLSLVDAPLVEVTSSGSDLWTGGAAGLEGGLGSTLAIALALAHVVRGKRRGTVADSRGGRAQAAAAAAARTTATGEGVP